MVMLRLSAALTLGLLLGFAPLSRAAAPPPPPLHAAIAKALPLLVKGGRGHMEERQCFACHNQAIPILALMTARERGFTVRREDVQEQLEYIAEHTERDLANHRKGQSLGGAVNKAGYALATLEWGGWKADATTAGLVEYLLDYDKDRDHWTPNTQRPPTSGSHFTATYLALRGLRVWGMAGQKERIAKRIAIVREWLLAAKAKDTEDRVSRLRALREVGIEGKAVAEAVQDLLRTQRSDGGWAQLDEMDSDAYATATALLALHQAGGLPSSDKVYQRGVAWLLKSQRSDGTWLVHTRSMPIQKYFESGFPHGKHQFISMAATGWAVTALALTIPEPKATAPGKR
jgi:hypothetical protein